MTKSRDLANAATALNAVSATELGFVDGVTSAIQTQIDTKLATATAATTYVANSLADAKGDLFVATADNTVTRLPVGNSGEQIVADSSTSTGLAYQANWAAGKNKIINSDYRINQRNFTSVTASDTYTFDRWRTLSGGTVSYAFTPQTFTAGTAPVAGYEGSTFLQCAISSASGSYIGISQRIEDVRTFANQSIVVSFWAKAASGTPSVDVVVNQDFGSGGSGSVNTIGTKQAITTSWTRYSFKITVPSISGKTIGTSSFTNVYLLFSDAVIGSGVGDQTGTFQIWGFQAETGTVATAFQTATGTIQGELAACQRYFFKSPEMSVVPGAATSSGLIRGGTNASGNRWIGAFCLPVTMRVNPTCVVYNPNNGTAGQMRNEDANTNVTVSGIFGQYTNTVTQIDFSPTTSANNVVVGYITASAEL